MKRTPISSRPSSFSTSFSHVNKSRNLAARTRVAGSPSGSSADSKGTSYSRNASAISNRLSTLDTQTPTGDTYKDRLLQKSQQELESLKRENSELKAELHFIRSLYKQLVEEVPLEKFDERRVNLLKSQVIQLERQVLLQSSALQARRSVFLQVENKLLNLKEMLRSLHSSDDSSNYITISRESVQSLEYKVEGTRLDLYKNKENAETDDLSLPAVYMSDFLKQSRSGEDQALTLLDCCSGKVEHLNLKHVSRLESKLCKLYKNMVCLNEMLQHQSSSTSVVLTSEHISQPIRDRLTSHVTTVTDMLRDCSEDLLSLSVLYPAAPWLETTGGVIQNMETKSTEHKPPLKKIIRKDLTEENIMSHMPDLSRKKQQEVRSVVQGLMKSVSYLKYVMSLEIKILKEELSFHQQVYECQSEYAESLLSAVSEAYQTFEGNLKELLCKPLGEILSAYERLKDTASENDLRIFLSSFKDHAAQLSDAVDFLQSHQHEDEQGVSALSEYHRNFLGSLHSLTRECVAKRDMLMKQLLEAKDDGVSGESMASMADNETMNTSESGQTLYVPHQTSR